MNEVLYYFICSYNVICTVKILNTHITYTHDFQNLNCVVFVWKRIEIQDFMIKVVSLIQPNMTCLLGV